MRGDERVMKVVPLDGLDNAPRPSAWRHSAGQPLWLAIRGIAPVGDTRRGRIAQSAGSTPLTVPAPAGRVDAQSAGGRHQAIVVSVEDVAGIAAAEGIGRRRRWS